MNETYKPIDWEQRRFEIAKAMAAALLSNPEITTDFDFKRDAVAFKAVLAAEELIEELKR